MSTLPCGRLLATFVALTSAVFAPVSLDQSRAAERGDSSYQAQSLTAVVADPIEVPLVAPAPLQPDERPVSNADGRGTASNEESDLPAPSDRADAVPTIGPPPIQRSEPFGLRVSALVAGGIQNKWRGVAMRLPGEHALLLRCRVEAEACSPAAKRFLDVLDRAQSREGWARIAEVNRTINLDVRPVDDMTQYGVEDLWATPLMTFKSSAGDCEDYAIAKYVALHELGINFSDLRLVIVHDDTTRQDHAVTAVRYDGRWNILDNRTLEIRTDTDIANFQPLFLINSDGAKHVIAWSPQPPVQWLAGNEIL
jgi:predicted transglutaminase-like cysteine proteinase